MRLFFELGIHCSLLLSDTPESAHLAPPKFSRPITCLQTVPACLVMERSAGKNRPVHISTVKASRLPYRSLAIFFLIFSPLNRLQIYYCLACYTTVAMQWAGSCEERAGPLCGYVVSIYGMPVELLGHNNDNRP
jgi:hypothetical protein